jgi:hypothetical protein
MGPGRCARPPCLIAGIVVRSKVVLWRVKGTLVKGGGGWGEISNYRKICNLDFMPCMKKRVHPETKIQVRF